ERGVVPGLLMETVDVLGDDGEQLPAPLQLDQGAMARVGLGREHRRLEPSAPPRLSHLGIAHPITDVGLLLGAGVLRPDALRAAEVRDARVSRDPRTREDDDLPRLVYPPLDVCLSRHETTLTP